MSDANVTLHYSDDGVVATVTMTRTDRRNSLDAALAADLAGACSDAVSAGARAIILRAEPGVSVWCAGQDISELPQPDDDPTQWNNTFAALLANLREVPIPLIAAVEGGVWGGAVEVVLTADLIVCDRASTFAITPAKLGVAYTPFGIATFLGSMPSQLVKQMFFTADPVTAQRLYDVGVINELVDGTEALTIAAEQLASRIAQRAPLTQRATKADAQALLQFAADAVAVRPDLHETRMAAWSSEDYAEGLTAFSERRHPHFRGK